MLDKTLAPATKKLFDKLKSAVWLKNYYLAGGTALALHFGHRQSIDLDWFTLKQINTLLLTKRLAAIAPFEVTNRADNTLEGIMGGVKVSFMTYPYPLLSPAVNYNNIKLAAPLDIAIMKLGAITDRNTKKDFINLYEFLRRGPMSLSVLIDNAEQKFAPVRYDRYHILKSLSYFADADTEAMPKMFIKLDWGKIKKFFIQEVKKLNI